jgi:tRNA threonylcarbamoyl adenosine modification protein (Sua5/YciO/YrdC/YwlC family)
MYVEIESVDADLWRLEAVARTLRNGGVGVVPTDTVYAFVCGIEHKSAIERLYQIKKMDPKKPLSILCRDFQTISKYTRGFDNNWFRVIRRCLPGPYTFIMTANARVPRIMLRRRRTIGVRMPGDAICMSLLELVDSPLLCTSVRTLDDSFWNVPAEISETYLGRLDFVVDGGERLAEPSTVVDLTGRTPNILRAGKGVTDDFE